MAGVTFL